MKKNDQSKYMILKNKEYISELGRFRIYFPTPISQLPLRDSKPDHLPQSGFQFQ